MKPPEIERGLLSSLETSVVQKSLFLIGESGWESFQLSHLLRPCGSSFEPRVTIEFLKERLLAKEDIITLIQLWIKSQLLLETFDFDDELGAQEKIFEIVMRRFDLITQSRPAFLSLQRAYFSSLKNMASGLGFLNRAVCDIFLLAGEKVTSVDVWAFTGWYATLLRTWSQDNTSDLSKTMAHLDRILCDFYQVR